MRLKKFSPTGPIGRLPSLGTHYVEEAAKRDAAHRFDPLNAPTASPDDLRAEQLRLVLEGVAQSVVVGFLVATLMFFVLWPLASHGVLIGWYAAFLSERAVAAIFAYRTLRAPREVGRDRRAVRILLVSKAIEGSIYGFLLCIGLPLRDPPVSILLMSLMGAVLGNGVSLLSPLRPLYLALAIPMALLAVISLWSLGGTPYRVLAFCSILYVVGQYGQVRLASRRVRDAIMLRFENVVLVDQLRIEGDVARLARQNAEYANAAKSRVLAAASHDLRQPVHAIGLFLQALSHTTLNDDQRRIVKNVQAASLASSDMLNTLLDFSRLEAGVVTPQIVPFALQPLLDRLEAELAPLADAKGLIYRSPPTRATVASDPALFEMALRNLISNAIRYTDQGGLLIGCRRRGEALSIEVFDTGVGIAPHHREEIFREFHQLGNPERDRSKGLGLGLAIVRGLAASLAHPLSLSSVEGRGSIFRLLVPLAGLTPPAHVPVPSRHEVGRLEGKRVLIIEDDPIVRDAMMQICATWGCRSLAVEGPDEALSLFAPREIPDVIVCDYRLRDDLTGAEAIRTLRAHFLADVPAIIITGDTAPERIREALASGVPLLHKPVAPNDLRASLLDLILPATT